MDFDSNTPEYAASFVSFHTSNFVTRYTLEISLATAPFKWRITRRYSEFLDLRNVLALSHPVQVPKIAFPKKIIFASLAPDRVLNERAHALTDWLNQILRSVEPDPMSIALRKFLNLFQPCKSLPPDMSVGLDNNSPVGPPVRSRDGRTLLVQPLPVYIFSYLETRDSSHLSVVCKGFWQASTDPLLWSSTGLEFSCPDLERRQQGLIRILYRAASTLPQMVLKLRFNGTPRLRQSLPMCMHFNRLTRLCMRTRDSASYQLFCEILDSVCSSDYMPLRDLDICGPLDMECLRPLEEVIKQLVNLRLTWTDNPRLGFVDLTEDICIVVEEMLSAAKSLRALAIMAEDETRLRRSTFTDLIAVVAKLPLLDAFECDFIDDNQLMNTFSMPEEALRPIVMHMTGLRAAPNIRGNVFAQLLPKLSPNLISLHLEEFQNPTQRWMFQGVILPPIYSLSDSLHFAHLTDITLTAVASLATSGLAALVDAAAENLRVLAIRDSIWHLSDECGAILNSGKLVRLERLELIGVNDLWSDAFLEDMESMGSLSVLKLSRSRNMTDAAINHLKRELTPLAHAEELVSTGSLDKDEFEVACQSGNPSPFEWDQRHWFAGQ
ncbi:hypothetical protein Pmar_PMAR013831 [Perkinsus marinus ATCC 50983]|uniref:PX domain-containing protein n=1 Tax=Perkinsus marinus (strain ATCC 50983 / TXsc) TaxID=423536 RepID=C5L916_PERM5|nr:hypothetical protein Pmar_PMAR013831 [Perkinsus marinus ATCC 50983]EER06780.1 hypothetical protein Pmar_PMAR013831 [Perkinsus marinus ATCC 50983]|eukprot:XP_002774964.1 hypothetical protein Pmar_PMAR013831 [Perkinsus marinus ATCC 50983]